MCYRKQNEQSFERSMFIVIVYSAPRNGNEAKNQFTCTEHTSCIWSPILHLKPPTTAIANNLSTICVINISKNKLNDQMLYFYFIMPWNRYVQPAIISDKHQQEGNHKHRLIRSPVLSNARSVAHYIYECLLYFLWNACSSGS